MKKVSLNGAWTLCVSDTEFQNVAATVPGSVYNDLLNAGLMEDPFKGANENEALKIMDHDFTYERSFEVDADLLSTDRVLLRAEGLDTLATICLNGTEVAKTDNMHRTWEFDVRSLLKEGKNDIVIVFASPTLWIKEAYKNSPQEGSSDAMQGVPLLRKAHCMFGWDWGPHLPDAGIWRDISLIGIETARIGDVRVHQIHEDGKVSCEVITNECKVKECDVKTLVSITAPDGTVI
ncbi:MAG: glycoside hydrolase family 2 protein, partial [Oscillospiraceae bacterium]|nr:glycoside hydrolase family 2 protein [Oscillospiraceae bacterium]